MGGWSSVHPEEVKYLSQSINDSTLVTRTKHTVTLPYGLSLNMDQAPVIPSIVSG